LDIQSGHDSVRANPKQVPPVEILKREMELRGWQVARMAQELDVKPQTLYNLTGQYSRKISSRLASRLSTVLGETMEFWLSDFVPEDAPLTKYAAGPARARFVDEPEVALALASRQTGVLNDEALEFLLGRADGPIEVVPFDPAMIRSASIDLKIGFFIKKGFTKLTREDWLNIGTYWIEPDRLESDEQDNVRDLLAEYKDDIEYSDLCELEPGKSVLAIGAEFIRLNADYLARIGHKTQNALEGIHVLHGFQIDPGYEGPLIVRIINLLDDSITLSAGRPMLSLEIARLPQRATKPYSANVPDALKGLSKAFLGAVTDGFTYKRGADGKRTGGRLRATEEYQAAKNGRTIEDTLVELFLSELRDRSDSAHGMALKEAKDAMGCIEMEMDAALALAERFNSFRRSSFAINKLFSEGKAVTLKQVVDLIELKPREVGVTLILDYLNDLGQTKEAESTETR
jgi:deoxycytidine triphosphate deaminase